MEIGIPFDNLSESNGDLNRINFQCHSMAINYPLYGSYYYQLLTIAALSIAASPVAVTLNILCLLAIYKTRKLHTLSNYIICGLSSSDLFTGLITQPLFSASCFNYRLSQETLRPIFTSCGFRILLEFCILSFTSIYFC